LELNPQVGAGKTKLVAHVVDSLQNRPADEALAYFYCNRNEEARRKPSNILKSFVKQLSILHHDKGRLHGSLVEKYQEKYRSGFASAHLSDEEAKDLLSRMAQSYQRTILVVDALDECEETSRLKLITIFNQLIEEVSQIKILISSRRDVDIKRKLETKTNLEIDATKNEEDIKKFVLARLDEDAADRAIPFSDSLRGEIVDTLFKKSLGM
jgi:Cdc6-like AAA superfamily ATPase